MKIVLGWLSDTHIGYQQYGRVDRRADFASTMRGTLENMVKAGVTAIIHTGDMFHSNRPSSADIRAFQEMHDLLVQAGVPMYVVSGNHDYTDPPWTDVLDTQADRGIILADNRRIAVGNVILTGYASMSRPQLLERFSTDNLDDVDVLMLHQMVKDFVGFPPPGALEVSDIPDKFQLVAIGDVHITDLRVRTGKHIIGYPGSTESNSTSEPDEHYWIKVTFENRVLVSTTKVRCPHRRIWRWRIDTEEDLTRLLDGAEAELAATRLQDMRYPIVVVDFPTSLENVTTRIKAKLDPDLYVLQWEPRYPEPEKKAQQDTQSAEDVTIDDILRAAVPADDKLFMIASQLLQPSTDAKVAMEAYVGGRMKLIENPELVDAST